MNPLVSVIIPCYNYGNYLPEALDSIRIQSLQSWECILVDNGSTDNTKGVCESACSSDTRFSYYSIANDGPSHARNFGIGISSGKYIQFLDADDLLQPDKLKAHAGLLEGENDVDLVYSSARFFRDNNPGKLYYSPDGREDKRIPEFSGEGKSIVNRLLLGNIMPVCSPLIRKPALDKSGLMDEQLRGYEDWDLILRLAIMNARFRFYETDNGLPLIRQHEKSLSRIPHHMDTYLVTVLEKNVFHPELTLGSRCFLLFRYFQQINLYRFKRVFGKSAHIVHSNKLNPFKLFVLQMGTIIYLPFYILAEALKGILKLFGKKY